ncbi:MAG: D-alanyl-D-alanine carboxypeptidase family protein [Paracoccaceae bacterium]|uniref:D-alanyl-D-alanine carboxypeptidase family protein n=1 Tax=Seohaeicola saemankumensis TaxID=481181 RepID=UPI001E659389|nr:D-alanyl-D-alanine carboxypeptidase family protein [Seohaeicola saemankumensis]MCD1625304.1 D-alanyl-D-alanine carboxypeptidase [Seohaeicola saemankumensis]
MKVRHRQPARLGLFIFTAIWLIVVLPLSVRSAPYAAMVIDARNGEVLHSENADTRLHPASLTKMMTLYVAFQAIERGEISLDTVVTVPAAAAAEPPSKLGLRAGQKIKLRYLIRAAAIKSANDAAHAIGTAIEGSEAAYARRMNRTAAAMGMTRTTFKNMHGLTQEGHMSTARDMTILGRHMLYDFPEYYNLFSRRSTDAGIAHVNNTNRRMLDSYRGADGIKTGYTRAAGFNLVASAERGGTRVIATVFGGRSTVTRNQRVAELLDLGFKKAPANVALRKPVKPDAIPGRGPSAGDQETLVASVGTGRPAAGKTIRLVTAVSTSLRPVSRPGSGMPPPVLVAVNDSIAEALSQVAAQTAAVQVATAQAATVEAEATPIAVINPPASIPERPVQIAELAAVVEDEEMMGEGDARDTLTPEDLAPEELAAEALTTAVAEAQPAALAAVIPVPSVKPRARPDGLVVLASLPTEEAEIMDAAPAASQEPDVVTRISTSGGRHWGINVGRYGSRHAAEKVLLQTALTEMNTLDGALRKIKQGSGGFDANFMGLTRETADMACRRLQARQVQCFMIGPS